METGIEVQARGNSLSKPPGKQFLTWLVTKLTGLAMARQATVDAATLKFFASALANYEPIDLTIGIDKLCHTRRAEGETAFPDLPTIEDAVAEARGKRQAAERKALEAEQEALRWKHMREHPEEYVTAAEFIHNCLKKWNEAKTAKQKSPWESLKDSASLTDKQRAELAEILKNRGAR